VREITGREKERQGRERYSERQSAGLGKDRGGGEERERDRVTGGERQTGGERDVERGESAIEAETEWERAGKR